jgi:hypothetical protein
MTFVGGLKESRSRPRPPCRSWRPQRKFPKERLAERASLPSRDHRRAARAEVRPRPGVCCGINRRPRRKAL